MFSLIIGGSGSGKSAYAEQLLCDLPDVKYKYYLATMQICDKDSENRANRHRELRQGKGLITIEQHRDITSVLEQYDLSEAAVLLECMSNLTAGEMFAETIHSAKNVIDKILRDTKNLKEHTRHLVIVTNNVFEDTCTKDEGSREYMEALAEINREIALCADEVVEVIAGLPVRLKGRY